MTACGPIFNDDYGHNIADEASGDYADITIRIWLDVIFQTTARPLRARAPKWRAVLLMASCLDIRANEGRKGLRTPQRAMARQSGGRKLRR